MLKEWNHDNSDLAEGSFAEDHQEVEVLGADHVLAAHVVWHKRVLNQINSLQRYKTRGGGAIFSQFLL